MKLASILACATVLAISLVLLAGDSALQTVTVDPDSQRAQELQSRTKETAAASPQWFDFYRAGKLRLAVKTMASTAQREADPNTKFGLYSMLMEVCARHDDFDCLLAHAPSHAKAYLDFIDKSKDGGLKAFATLSLIVDQLEYYVVGQQWDQVERILKGRDEFSKFDFDRAIRPEITPALYVRAHLAAARYYLLRGELRRSQDEISKVISAAVIPFSGINETRFSLALLIPELVIVSLENGDTLRAIRIAALAGGLVEQQLANVMPDRARWETVKGEIYLALQMPKLAQGAFQESQRLYKGVDAPEDLKDWALSSANNREAVVRVLQGDIAGARLAHSRNPFASSAMESLAEGRFDPKSPNSMGLFWFAVSEIYLDFAAGKAPDRRWLTLIEQFDLKRNIMASEVGVRQGLALQKFALGIIKYADEPVAGAKLVFDATEGLLEGYSAKLSAAPDTFPMPDWIDRIVLETAIAMEAMDRTHDPRAGSIVLRAADVLNRSALQSAGDLATVVAAAGSGLDGIAARSVLALSAQSRSYEESGIKQLVGASGPNHIGKKEFGEYEWWRSSFTRSLRARRFLTEQSSARGNFGVARGTLPSLGDVQGALESDEAFLTTLFLPMGAVQVCINKDGLFMGRRAYVAADVETALKLVKLALTATHPKSEAADSQFPVSSAVLLHDVVLGESSRCLAGKSRIIYSAHPFLASVPMHVLLPRAPPRLGTGFDLSSAEWVGWRYAISAVSSAQGFLSTRRIRQTARFANGGYLGVGNPVLGTNNAALTASLTKLRASAETIKNVRELSALPETATEIRNSARLFGVARSRVLLGSEATEARLRQQPLSEFGVVGFATHGLLSGDVVGLSEAALVLTPEGLTESATDGLLAASELAQLQFRAKLVILSACNSANNDLGLFAPSLQGLATALSAAGVPSVLGTSWSVESVVSQNLVESFAGFSAQGLPVDRALLHALLRIRGQRDRSILHPRFWAAFGIYGDGATKLEIASTTNSFVQSWSDEGTNYTEILGYVGPPTSLRSDDLWFVGFSHPRPDAHATLEVSSLGDRNKLVREYSKPDRGAGASFDMAGDAVILTYKFDGKDTEVFATRFGRKTKIGAVERQVLKKGGMHVPFAAIAVSANSFVFATISRDGAFEGVRVWRMQDSKLSQTDIALADGGTGMGGRFYRTASNELLLIASSHEVPGDMANFALNEYATPSFCEQLLDFRTRVARIDTSNFATIAEKDLPFIRIADYDVPSRRFVGTRTGGCRSPTTGISGILDAALDVHVDYESPPLGIQFNALDLDGSKLRIVGTITRKLALKEPTQRMSAEKKAERAALGAKGQMIDSSQATDIVRLDVDLESRKEASRIVGYGGDVYVSAATRSGRKFVVMGSVGGNAFVAHLD